MKKYYNYYEDQHYTTKSSQKQVSFEASSFLVSTNETLLKAFKSKCNQSTQMLIMYK